MITPVVCSSVKLHSGELHSTKPSLRQPCVKVHQVIVLGKEVRNVLKIQFQQRSDRSLKAVPHLSVSVLDSLIDWLHFSLIPV